MSLKKWSKVKGFTLIELMIVVAIIGILAAVAIPKFADLVTKSKEASIKGTVGSVRSALSIYYGDMEGVFPINIYEGLTAANKYLPSTSGTGSLGRYQIPAVNPTGNSGHSSGVYDNASSAASYWALNAAATWSDGTPLAYNSSGGEVYINCTHNDTKSVKWTSY